MPDRFPLIPFERFCSRLLSGVESSLSGTAMSESACRAMYDHYSELAAWNHRISLVGEGTWDEVVERHFIESLHGLAWFSPGSTLRVVDIGSGGGFPGLPLLAARPSLELTLVESRQRKWAFLKAAARRAALPCRCLNARVSRTLPQGFPEVFDVVLMRAVRLEPPEWSALFRGAPDSRSALVWAGRKEPSLPPELEVAEETRLTGSQERRIVTIRNK